MESVLIYVFFIGLAGLCASTLIRFVLGLGYDFQRTTWEKSAQKHPNSRKLRDRPPLTIAIYVEDTANYLPACVESIASNDYRKYEILIINNSSGDDTKEAIKYLQASYPKKAIDSYTKRVRTSRAEAVVAALKSLKEPELVLVLDAASQVSGSLQKMVRRMSDEHTEVLVLNSHVSHNYQLFGIVHEFRSAVATLQKKSGLKISRYGDAYNYAACYKSSALKSCMGKKSRDSFDDINKLRETLGNGVVFEPNVAVSSLSANQNITKASKGISAEDVLLTQQLTFAGIMTFVAVYYKNTHYLLAGWLIFTILLLIPLWTDSSRQLSTKWSLSFMAPLAYPLYFLDFCVSILIRTPARYASNLSTIK